MKNNLLLGLLLVSAGGLLAADEQQMALVFGPDFGEDFLHRYIGNDNKPHVSIPEGANIKERLRGFKKYLLEGGWLSEAAVIDFQQSSAIAEAQGGVEAGVAKAVLNILRQYPNATKY